MYKTLNDVIAPNGVHKIPMIPNTARFSKPKKPTLNKKKSIQKALTMKKKNSRFGSYWDNT